MKIFIYLSIILLFTSCYGASRNSRYHIHLKNGKTINACFQEAVGNNIQVTNLVDGNIFSGKYETYFIKADSVKSIDYER